MYAWTDIKHAEGTLKAGDTATAKKLGIEDEEFDQLVEARAIRSRKYPDMPADFTGSPVDFVIAEHRKQLEDVEDVMLGELEAVQEAEDATSLEDEEVKEDN
jgi:hypothetical protein